MPSPIYDLQEVVRLAREGRVLLRRSAQRDAQELGYSSLDINECIAALRPNDFHKSIEYEDGSYDVYHTRFWSPSGNIDDLYVKLKAPTTTTVPQVIVISFHR